MGGKDAAAPLLGCSTPACFSSHFPCCEARFHVRFKVPGSITLGNLDRARGKGNDRLCTCANTHRQRHIRVGTTTESHTSLWLSPTPCLSLRLIKKDGFIEGGRVEASVELFILFFCLAHTFTFTCIYSARRWNAGSRSRLENTGKDAAYIGHFLLHPLRSESGTAREGAMETENEAYYSRLAGWLAGWHIEKHRPQQIKECTPQRVHCCSYEWSPEWLLLDCNSLVCVWGVWHKSPILTDVKELIRSPTKTSTWHTYMDTHLHLVWSYIPTNIHHMQSRLNMCIHGALTENERYSECSG